MSGLLNGRETIDKTVGPEKLKEEYLKTKGGTVSGDLTVSGNTTLSNRATYKGNEIATTENISDLNVDIAAIKDSISDIQIKKADITEVNNLLSEKQDNLIGGENIDIAQDGVTISSSTKVAGSDRILTYDAAGLKANISVTVDGNEITFYGKNDPDGEPYVLAEFNVLQSQIIENVYIDEATKELVITFVVDGDPGTETVRVDLTDFINVYDGTEYIDITGQDISLKYEELRDQLINDGMALQGDLPTIPTNLVNTDGAQTISGAKTFSNTTTFTSAISTRNIIPDSAGIRDIGAASTPYNNGHFVNLLKNGVEVATVNDIPVVPTNYVTTDTQQTITGAKNFTSRPTVNNSQIALLTDIPSEITGYVDVSTNQTIGGTKTFNNIPIINSGAITIKSPSLSGGNIIATNSGLGSDVNFEAPNLAYKSNTVTTDGTQTISGDKTFSGNPIFNGITYVRRLTPTSSDSVNNNATIGSAAYPYTSAYAKNIVAQDSLSVGGVSVTPSNYVTNDKMPVLKYALENVTVDLGSFSSRLCKIELNPGTHLINCGAYARSTTTGVAVVIFNIRPIGVGVDLRSWSVTIYGNSGNYYSFSTVLTVDYFGEYIFGAYSSSSNAQIQSTEESMAFASALKIT